MFELALSLSKDNADLLWCVSVLNECCTKKRVFQLMV